MLFSAIAVAQKPDRSIVHRRTCCRSPSAKHSNFGGLPRRNKTPAWTRSVPKRDGRQPRMAHDASSDRHPNMQHGSSSSRKLDVIEPTTDVINPFRPAFHSCPGSSTTAISPSTLRDSGSWHSCPEHDPPAAFWLSAVALAALSRSFVECRQIAGQASWRCRNDTGRSWCQRASPHRFSQCHDGPHRSLR